MRVAKMTAARIGAVRMVTTPNGFGLLKSGGNICLPFASDDEKHAAIAGFVHDGLMCGERCVYWGHPAGLAELLANLKRRSIPAAAPLARGALVFADLTQAGDRFDASAQLALIRSAVSSARSDGFAGLRVAGDFGPKTGHESDHKQFAVFENSLSQLCDEFHATGLCAVTLDTADTSSREAAEARDLLEAECAALILENSRSNSRESDYQRQIATLGRAVEARDRLIITASRWLSRLLPTMAPRPAESAPSSRECDEHIAAVTRLSHGLDEVSSFLQMQVVLRPEQLDLVEVARAAIAEVGEEQATKEFEIALEGTERVTGDWDRLRIVQLFQSLIRTAREQGYDARARLRIEDLLQFARVRLEFMLPHTPALSDSGERMRPMAFGVSCESDYERLSLRLWSAREIVRIMGGTLGISTWADASVVFTLDLPKSSASSASTEKSVVEVQTPSPTPSPS